LIIDDVITAGTAVREVMEIVQSQDARVAGVVIGLDRKERGTGNQSAIQEVQEQFAIPVLSIIDIDDIMQYLESKADSKGLIQEIQNYRREFGV